MDTPHLLQDILTFLCWLKSHDVRLRGKRWLPPKALFQINAPLLVHDIVRLPARSNTGGRIGTRELDTHHIRFVHFLCEAAHLVARTGLYLKPTLRVKDWLTAAPFDQMRQLFRAVYPDQPSRPHDDLWHSYRLPGWSLPSPTAILIQPVIQLLRAAPAGEKVKLTTLLKLIPLPEDGDEFPADIIRGLLDQLVALGVLNWHGHAVRLTALGVGLIIPDAPPTTLTLQPSITLQFARQRYPLARTDFATLYQLSDYAELIAVKPQRDATPLRRYQLDRSLIRRALQRGHTLDGLLRFIEHALGDALPDLLAAPLRQWAAELDRVSVRRVTVLEVKDPATLTDLTRSHRVRESIQRTLSPRVVVVRESRLPALLRQLDRRGLTPRTNLPSRRQDRATTQLFDNPSLAQLYFAALLNQYLADQLPAPYRVDYSIVLELERALTPSDRLRAIQLAEEANAALNSLTSCPSASLGHPVSSTAQHTEHRLEFPLETRGNDLTLVARIEEAIAANTPLALTYYSPAYDQTTHRIVEPLRLEWHGDIPYLIAYCRLRRDERIFRVERIAELASASASPARSKKAA